MILGVRSADELQAQEVAVRARLGPNHLRVLDGLMIGRRANAERADLADRDAHVHRDP